MNYNLLEELKTNNIIPDNKKLDVELDIDYTEDENSPDYIEPTLRWKEIISFQYDWVKGYFGFRLNTFVLSFNDKNEPVLIDMRYKIQDSLDVEYNINYDVDNYELVITPIVNYKDFDKTIELIYFKWNIKCGKTNVYILDSDSNLCIEEFNFKKDKSFCKMCSKFYDEHTVRYLQRLNIIDENIDLDNLSKRMPINLEPYAKAETLIKHFFCTDGSYFVNYHASYLTLAGTKGNIDWTEELDVSEYYHSCEYHFIPLQKMGLYKSKLDFIPEVQKQKILEKGIKLAKDGNHFNEKKFYKEKIGAKN